MIKTRIAWATDVWNPVVGCTPISEGCAGCYASKLASIRLAHTKAYSGLAADGKWSGKIRLLPEKLDKSLHRRKPARVFVCSMGDLFHPDVPDEFILAVWQRMLRAPQHIFMILTKRPLRMKEICERAYTCELPNVWLGVTAENQPRLEERWEHLRNTPAAKRYISYEPALGPIVVPQGVDWVIVGGETGPGARECREEWVKSVYDQCQAAGVPFFFKQHGKKFKPMIERPPEAWLVRREWPE